MNRRNESSTASPTASTNALARSLRNLNTHAQSTLIELIVALESYLDLLQRIDVIQLRLGGVPECTQQRFDAVLFHSGTILFKGRNLIEYLVGGPLVFRELRTETKIEYIRRKAKLPSIREEMIRQELRKRTGGTALETTMSEDLDDMDEEEMRGRGRGERRQLETGRCRVKVPTDEKVPGHWGPSIISKRPRINEKAMYRCEYICFWAQLRIGVADLIHTFTGVTGL